MYKTVHEKKLNPHKYVLYMCSLWFIFDTNDNIDNDMIIVFSFKCLNNIFLVLKIIDDCYLVKFPFRNILLTIIIYHFLWNLFIIYIILFLELHTVFFF